MAKTATDQAATRDGGARSTRERILDVALDLFVEQGYDGTSLREIAEVMGFSKAALYYHFASKDEILLALHLRIHDLFGGVLTRMVAAERTPEVWRAAISDLIDAMVDQRQLVLFQQRNHSAIARDLPGKHQHDEANEDMEAAVGRILGDNDIPPGLRVRLAAAMGAVIIVMTEAAEALSAVPSETIAAECRAIVADILS